MKFNNKNVMISPSAKIGANVKIGDNTVIYDNVVIGDNTIICNDCHIGEPLTDYYRDEHYVNPETKIGDNCLIRSHTIVYVQNQIGDNLTTGHRVIIRANNIIGNNCTIGNETEIHGRAKLGNYVRLHSDVCICETADIGDFVWIAPGTILTNDASPPSNILKGPIIGDFTMIAVNVVTLPGIKIGKHCLIGAAALVTRDVKDYSVIVGNPGRYLSDIREIKPSEKEYIHYPWPNNFDKGMPWEGIGYEKWLEER